MLQTAKDVIGVALQTQRGVPAAAPQFAHGIAGGGVKVEPNQEPDPLTSAYVSPANAFRDKVENGADFTARAWYRSIGLYLLAALGDVATVGVGAPYEHTFTLGDDLPYLTVFELKGDGTVLGAGDGKLDELELSWEENKPLELGAKIVACGLSFPATFEADVDELDDPGYFTPVGGTFKLDVDSETPTEARVKGGSIAVKRSAEAQFYSGVIEAGDVHEGACDAEVGLTIVPDDLSEWRTIVTGAADGTSVQPAPVYGSFEIELVSPSGAETLTISASRVGFLADLPEGDPEGGAAEIELSGVCYRDGSTPLTAVLSNTHASYVATPGGSEE